MARRPRSAGQVHQHHIDAAPAEPGLYRTVTGAEALSLGLVAGAQLAGLDMFFGGYPITPASAILHHLSRLKEYRDHHLPGGGRDRRDLRGDRRQSYAGQLGVTSSSGPGIALKTEAIGLAIMTELPLVIVNSQRGGPSTGLPTKTEQSDLYQAVYGRNGDAPLPVIAARSPADAFECAIEACRIATRYMTPVMLLTDGYIANAAEPWKVPDMSGYAPFPVAFHDTPPAEGEGVMPYARNDELARPWIKPGTPGLEHRIGGIEKAPGPGNIDYSPRSPCRDDRHPRRQGRQCRGLDPRPGRLPRRAQAATLAVVGWGSTFGPIHQAVRRARGARARTSATSTSATSGRCRKIWAALLKGFRADPRARDEHRPVEDRAARPVPGRRPAADQGRGPALPDRRDRSRDRGGVGDETLRSNRDPFTLIAHARSLGAVPDRSGSVDILT